MFRRFAGLFSFASMILFSLLAEKVAADDLKIHSFKRQQLSETYFSEGANAADINGDKKPDVVYGPYWFAGPDFKTKSEIYKPVPQDVNRYADNCSAASCFSRLTIENNPLRR